jgi:trehalose utilization protein
MTLNVTIWNEFRHEKVNQEARKVYPDGLHAPIAEHLRAEGMTVRAATLDEPEHGGR